MKYLCFCFIFLLLLQHVSSSARHVPQRNGMPYNHSKLDEINCSIPITRLKIKYFSIADIVGRHEMKSVHYLEYWTVFFFSHFYTLDSFILFLTTMNREKFIQEESYCVRRAITLYLLTYYASNIRFLNAKELEMKIDTDFRGEKNFFLKELQDLLEERNYSYLQTLFQFEYTEPIGKSLITHMNLAEGIADKNDAAFAAELREKINETFYNGNFFQNSKIDISRMSFFEQSLIFDFNWFINVSLLSFYSKSDITYVDFEKLENSRKKKLGMRYRSKRFDLQIPEPGPQQLIYFNEGDDMLLDDLVQMFFSVIKYKMVKGNEALIKDLNTAKEKKSYLLTNLKGLRKVKYFFKTKNAKSIFDMNLHLVSTELKFLTEDFVSLFEKSAVALVKTERFTASDVYLTYRGIKL